MAEAVGAAFCLLPAVAQRLAQRGIERLIGARDEYGELDGAGNDG